MMVWRTSPAAWTWRARTAPRRIRRGAPGSSGIASGAGARRSPLVVAKPLRAAMTAAELGVVETKDSPAVATVAAARAAGAPAVWDEVPDNVAFVWKKGDAGEAITQASHVVRLSSHVSRVAALTLEPRRALGRVDEAGRLGLPASHQGP